MLYGSDSAVIIGCGGIAVAAAHLIGRRCRLIMCDIDPEAVGRAVADLTANGIAATGHQCDITDPQSVARFAGRFDDASLAGAVHVAALAPSCGDWRQLMRVNLVAPKLIASALVPKLRPGGSLVFVGSVAAYMASISAPLADVLADPLHADFMERLERASADPLTPASAYLISKAALLSLAEALAVEWGPRGVRALSVSPGLIESPMGLRERAHNPATGSYVDITPLGREGSVAEAAAAIDFAASPAASFLNGVDILVDGGLRAALRTTNVDYTQPTNQDI